MRLRNIPVQKGFCRNAVKLSKTKLPAADPGTRYLAINSPSILRSEWAKANSYWNTLSQPSDQLHWYRTLFQRSSPGRREIPGA